MKNVENYGVQTLNTLDIKTINGGQSDEPPAGWEPSQDTVWLGTVSGCNYKGSGIVSLASNIATYIHYAMCDYHEM